MNGFIETLGHSALDILCFFLLHVYVVMVVEQEIHSQGYLIFCSRGGSKLRRGGGNPY